ncbi:MAG: LysE family translocator [Candidatus Dormibacteraeota bacterium]|nr:LysE family translocator [Candidatus Dormibacteraeota bacterium]
MTVSLLAGLGLGFLVGAQVGPIWLLCARSSLRHGARVGLGIGAGAAIVDLLYAALGVAGAASLLAATGFRIAFGLLGAAVLMMLGARTLWSAFRIRAGGEADAEVASTWVAFQTGLGATASNPMTIASWGAIFAAASAASLASTVGSAVLLVLGVGLGSMAWFAILSFAMAILRRRVPERGLRVADGVAGVGLIGFGAALGYESVQHR